MQKHSQSKGNRIVAWFIFASVTLGLLPLNPARSSHHDTPTDVGETQPTKHPDGSELEPRVHRQSEHPLSANTLTANLPLSFEPNLGQTTSPVKFLARAPGYNMFLMPTEAVFALRTLGETKVKSISQATSEPPGPEPVSVLRLALKGANPQAPASGIERLPGVKNYLIGSDSSRWQSGVPTYSKVRFEEIYPGINLSYYGSQRQLEYDFEIAPGADPARIRLSCDGAKALKIDAAGDLVMKLKGGELRQHKPVVYQELNGQRVAIDGRFVIRGRHEIGFDIGKYDAASPLVIDPTLVYSTYLGAPGNDAGSSIDIDNSGNIYITGTTSSTTFPTQNPFHPANAGLDDVFVTKLNPAGSSILYSTYVGGAGTDRSDGLFVDRISGAAYVVGRVDALSVDFPTTAGAFATTYRGGDFDAFILKLNPAGDNLAYSTFLGGEENDSAVGVVADSSGNAYVTGGTRSDGFPTTANAIQFTVAGDTDAYLVKFNAAGSAILYSTLLGGGATDRGSSVKIDNAGNAYMVGYTSSQDFPTESAFQNSLAGSFDAFVAKIDTNASGVASLVFCSYLGGSSDDKGYGLALDPGNDVYVAGQTTSTDFPLLNPAQAAKGGSFDAFVARISSSGTKLYATYLGGSGDDRATGVAVNSAGNAYVTGFTASTNFPTAIPLQLSNGGGTDMFVAKLNSLGNGLLYSTYLGGSANEDFTSTTTFSGNIAVDSGGTAYVTGYTASSNFPTIAPIQGANAGGASDAFIAKISDTTTAIDFAISVSPASQTVNPGNGATYTVTITPSGGFTGSVALSVTGQSADTGNSFNPVSVNITDSNAKSSVLTLTTTVSTAPGTYALSISATSGNLQHNTSASLIVAGPASANLAITKTVSPNPAIVFTNLTYRIVVTNMGPSPATNTMMTDTLPAGITFVSASPTQGSCSGTTTVTCNFGSLAMGSSAIASILVTPQSTVQLSNTASASASESDPDLSDNSVTIVTQVTTQSLGPSMLDPNLSVHTVISGLSQPTSMALFGDGFFVLEKNTGKVQYVLNGAVQLTALDLAVNSASERGLLGIALHPDFAFNHFVYLYWTESNTGVDSTNLADVDLLGNRVDRYIWNGASLTFDRNIIRLRAFQADANQSLRGNHNGGILRFGPDGKLYILMGDNGRRGFLQNNQLGPVPDDQFGGPEPDDSHLTGFVLRLNDDGSAPPDNPFFNVSTSLTGQAAANIKKLYAYGVRNGFGMAFDPLSGNLWDQENGDDAFDEMNRITPGANNGWVETMGPVSRIAEYKSIESTYGAGNLQQLRWPPSLIADTPPAALASLYMLPGAHYNDPEFSWKYALAPAALGFVQGGGLGPQFEGNMLVGASRTFLSGGFLFRLKLTPDRLHFSFSDSRLLDLVADNTDKFDITESETLLIGKDFGIGTDIETGPNGNVFVVSNTNGAVYEITGNQPTLFVATLNGAQEVPPNNSTAVGTATLLLSPDELSARVSLSFNGLSSPESVAHIHGPAASGVTAPVLFPLPQGEFSDFEIPLNAADVQNLKNGLLYADVHSTMFVPGEIRGQFQMPAAASSFQFNSATLLVTEGAGDVVISVTRLGNTSAPATVNYATNDLGGTSCNAPNTGNASSRCDYESTAGSLNFAAGETSRTITIPLVNDSYAEGNESFTLNLTNAIGNGSTLGSPAKTTVTITDNDAVNGTNPLDTADFFVRQHYLDFLNREPDPNGYTFWTNEIVSCGSNAQCIDVKRVNVSAAFFLSIEFQETGFLVYRMYKATYGNMPGAPVPLKLEEFLPDTQQIGKSVIVGQTGWEQQLENNKVGFAQDFVSRSRFTAAYPTTLTPAEFVDALFTNAGVTPLASERSAAIDEFGGAGNTADTAARARALRRVADNSTLKQQETNKAFVLMQYFGYLRRNPNDAPEPGLNFDGYNFWLGKLNEFNGNFVNAEMVKAFLVSGEYRQRFGP
jgi:uncharacterized repeat protein (TIGR01451 family)